MQFALNPDSFESVSYTHLYEKTVSNLVECKSRGAYLMAVTTYGNYNIEDTADFVIYIPKTDPHFTVSLAVIPLQLMGYYCLLYTSRCV